MERSTLCTNILLNRCCQKAILFKNNSSLPGCCFISFHISYGWSGRLPLIENLSWIDSLLNASMILGGMGPVNEIHSNTGKIFASFYALFSGIIFLIIVGLIFAPIYHRFLHKFHIGGNK